MKSPSTHRRSSPKSRGKSPDSRRGRDRRSYNASVERDRSRRRNRGSASIGRVKDEEGSSTVALTMRAYTRFRSVSRESIRALSIQTIKIRVAVRVEVTGEGTQAHDHGVVVRVRWN